MIKASIAWPGRTTKPDNPIGPAILLRDRAGPGRVRIGNLRSVLFTLCDRDTSAISRAGLDLLRGLIRQQVCAHRKGMAAFAFTVRMPPESRQSIRPMRLGSTALASERVERRLAAILAADVAGYSRLMGADEEGTLARLKALRRELADPKIKEHRGRIVKTTGDGLLLEFASVVDAVRCAVEVQREMAARNADVPPDRRIEFRTGINVGDIIKDGRDIYGDGVNVARRALGRPALRQPHGLCR
jgi:hypothetical protein